MAVAYDAVSNAAAGDGGGFGTAFSWTHTPVGTPKGVIVLVAQGSDGGTDGVTTVTYGGVNVPQVTGSPNLKSAAESGGFHAFFLGSGIPTGARTVVVNINGRFFRRPVAITLTAGGDTEVVDADATINSDAVANPSVTLSLAGRTCFAAIGFFSGQDSVFSITPLANWSSRLEHDFGSATAGWYTYDTIGTADVTAGWTQASEDAVAIAVAISEAAVVVTGTLAATEGADTAAGTGGPIVDGNLAATEGSDTLAATGGPVVDGSLAATESADSLAATGGPIVDGALAATEGSDSFAGTGSVEGGEVPAPVASQGGGKVRRRILTEHFDQVIATGRNPRRRVEQLLLARVI